MMRNFTLASILSGILLLFSDCQSAGCGDLVGRWTNREGQIFQFEAGGKALWLVQFGSKFDTFPIHYQYDCKQTPATLDLSGFQSGPLSGKTLFGIVEWASDTVFRFDCEPGSAPDVRPATFNPAQAQRYFRD
jgi:hypothetical protein